MGRVIWNQTALETSGPPGTLPKLHGATALTCRKCHSLSPSGSIMDEE